MRFSANFPTFPSRLSNFARMRNLLFFAAIALLPLSVRAQVHCTADNQQRLQRQLLHLQAQAQALGGNSMEEIIVAVGKGFLGTPYVAKTLEISAEEPLVIDLAGLDCTTFLENVVVFSRLVCLNEYTEAAFYRELELLRYQQGKREGYASRNHYFTQWLLDNEQKNIIAQVSGSIGGSPWKRPVNFMSAHASLYPLLDAASLPEIRADEQVLSGHSFSYLPKDQISRLEGGIRNGDLIAITTSVEGLDVAHVGFAVWVNDRVHLMHASSTGKEVVISDEPLADYLAAHRSQTGVMVARVNDPR